MKLKKETAYLVPLFNPIGPEGSTRIFIFKNDECFEIDPSLIGNWHGTYVTYRLSLLTSVFHGQIAQSPLPNFVDIDVAFSLIYGTPENPTSSIAGNTFLDFLNKSDDVDFQPYTSYCFKGNRSIDEETIRISVTAIAKHLEKLWSFAREELFKRGEMNRFDLIEAPITNILIRRQSRGIRIDSEILKTKIDTLNISIANARRSLRKDYSILDPADRTQVIRSINKHSPSLSFYATEKNSWNVLTLLKLYALKCPLASALREYKEGTRTKKLLLGCGALENNYVFPEFKIIGTVTGRIISRNPSLQNLPKRHRDILIPEYDMQFCYPDFRQCEPGILAQDCGDENLIEDYNKGDLYSALSEALFGNSENRDSAKLFFLFVCYGMSDDRLIQIGSDVTGISKESFASAIRSFFARYPLLPIWRANILKAITEEGRIGTAFGNYRYFKGESESASLRGGQSQRVQGTSALILKEIILLIDRKLPHTQIILPMHDALLLSIPNENSVETKHEIENIFCECYRRYCPRILPKVSFNDFHTL